MQRLELGAAPAPLTDTQKEALISLLADEDPAIYQMVRTKLLAFGPASSEWLRPHVLSNNPMLRRRARAIIEHHSRQAADEAFLSYCRSHGEEFDLEDATGLLAQTRYPEINLEAYAALYDTWAMDLRMRLDLTQSPRHVLAGISRYLFQELGFAGHEQYTAEPDVSYLNRMVDTRKGNPIGLCILFLFVTRRLRLPITGIGLPGHFVCRYQSSKEEIYIDCFRKGAFMTKADCFSFLLHTYTGFQERVLSPLSARRILHRMCNNLFQTYAHLESMEEANRVRRYVAALAK